MFYTIEELVNQAVEKHNGSIADLMVATEMETSGRSREDIR